MLSRTVTRTRTIEWQDPQLHVEGVAKRTGLEFLHAILAGEIPPAPIGAALGFTLHSAEHGVVCFRGEPAEYQYNPMATVHGGWSSTLLDSAMGSAVMSVLDATEAYTTADLTVHLVRPIFAKTGPVIAEGRIIHRGKRLATADGRLTDQHGKLLAHATTTCVIFERTRP